MFLVLVCAGSPFDGMPPEGAEAGREPAVGCGARAGAAEPAVGCGARAAAVGAGRGVQTHGQLAAAAAIVRDFFFSFLTFLISEIEMYVVWIASIL